MTERVLSEWASGRTLPEKARPCPKHANNSMQQDMKSMRGPVITGACGKHGADAAKRSYQVVGRCG